MNLTSNSRFLFLFLVFFALFSCKTTGGSFSDMLDKHNNYDKFVDSYKNFVYDNDNLDFTIDFNANWKITTSSLDFNEMQKKYAQYVSTERSELLFIGENEKSGLCVRCIAEILGLPLDDYVKSVKNDNTDKNRKYKVNFTEEKKIVFDRFEAFHNVYEVELNPLNVFVFDTILFKNFNNNFRLEFWCTKKKYEENKEEINNIMKSITFEQEEIIESNSAGENKSDK